jgi:hypothetical protein
MKKIICFLGLLCFSTLMFSQVSFKDTVIYNTFPTNGSEQLLYDTIVNTTSNTLTVSWYKLSDQLLTGWVGSAIHDPISSYVFEDSSMHSFQLAPGASGYIAVSMIAEPNAAHGISYVTFHTNFGDMVFKFQNNNPAGVDHFATDPISIYPNPSVDELNISGLENSDYTMDILTQQGEVVHSVPAKGNTVLNLRSLANGMYILRLTRNGQSKKYYNFVKN